ncbi:MAG TPA: CHASE3 domain-containing protein, partial [Brevundimonas sp.]|nr:CHASE3 domain-containing protein [Brevundimonas sp.]
MIPALRPILQAAGQFLRTPTLGRRVAGLLAAAIVLLLVVNLAVFVMIRRTAEFNDAVDTGHNVRLTANEVLTLLVDAETGQRGYLLTGQPEYLEPYTASLERLPDRLAELTTLAGRDEDLAARVELLTDLSTQRLDVIDRSLSLARMGRMDAAADVLREGAGKRIMDQVRAEVAAIDEVQATRLVFSTRRTEWAATVTVIVNALAAVLILILAGVSAWMIRRYVVEIQEARDALDQLNAGLEHQVRDRT